MVKTSISDVQKGVWNEDEDGKTASYASKQRAAGNWTTSSKRSGQRRSVKSCRERWSNNQKPDPKLKSFTPQEEELVIQLHAAIGSRWPIIALQIPGKTENDVKILWNSKLKKKLSAMGIDPVTHKPFSQILADYGNIGAFPKARTRLSSLSRDLKSAVILKPEQSPVKAELSDHLYSQLQAINLVTEASSYTNTTQHYMNECASSAESPYSAVNQEVSSFSWSDFFLEDAFSAQENAGQLVHCDDENSQVKPIISCGDEINGGSLMANDRFDAEASPSNTSAFVEAMIGKQDEMCSQLPCFYEEPFYY
ncbi:hypothetical protein C2S53_009202 [Perilla frutescens var. hirtella]|uniref:Uncharacterized protein n=1 Tax=Perilla frutescens var. hirtella TaxID=608512 RepID=A0AAD4IQI5_PERFH|nr:hypothetical protein C2S53_009202 [Perilla frutescens var. hirtella]